MASLANASAGNDGTARLCRSFPYNGCSIVDSGNEGSPARTVTLLRSVPDGYHGAIAVGAALYGSATYARSCTWARRLAVRAIHHGAEGSVSVSNASHAFNPLTQMHFLSETGSVKQQENVTA